MRVETDNRTEIDVETISKPIQKAINYKVLTQIHKLTPKLKHIQG